MSFLRQFQGRQTRLKIRVRTIFRPGQQGSIDGKMIAIN